MTHTHAAGAPHPSHLLHVFPSFGLGGVPIRIATVINHFGARFRHTIVALDGCLDCRTRLDPAVAVALEGASYGRHGLIGTMSRIRGRLRALGPDLLLTYNWGSIEWALTNRLFPTCPHVHLESGFGPEEADGQLRRRAWFRRIALARTGLVVVPSQTLVDIATQVWRLDAATVRRIPNGVDCERFAAAPDPAALPGFDTAPGQVIVGTVAPLRREKNLDRLLHAFDRAARDLPARLLILGDGAERPRLEALAAELDLADRVVFAGHVEAVERVIGLIDVFAMSSDTEQMPNSLLQAMAAGLPVAATDVGDVKRMVAAENGPYIVPRDHDAALGDALRTLLCDADARSRLGRANRERARRDFSQERMFRAYESVFGYPPQSSGHGAP